MNPPELELSALLALEPIFVPAWKKHRQDGETQAAFMVRVFRVFENLHSRWPSDSVLMKTPAPCLHCLTIHPQGPCPSPRQGLALFRALILVFYAAFNGFMAGLGWGLWAGVFGVFVTVWTIAGTALLMNRPPPMDSPEFFGRFANDLNDRLARILKDQIEGKK